MPISSNIPLLCSQSSLLQPNKQASCIRANASMRGGIYKRLLLAIKACIDIIVITITATQYVLLFEFQNLHLRNDVELLWFNVLFDFVLHNDSFGFRLGSDFLAVVHAFGRGLAVQLAALHVERALGIGIVYLEFAGTGVIAALDDCRSSAVSVRKGVLHELDFDYIRFWNELYTVCRS